MGRLSRCSAGWNPVKWHVWNYGRIIISFGLDGNANFEPRRSFTFKVATE
jgi:hypothetical protein